MKKTRTSVNKTRT